MMWISKAAVVAGLVALALVGWTSESSADASITLSENSVTRKVALREASLNPFWISKSDCVADDSFTFKLSLAGFAGLQLEVWAGNDDCTPIAARASTTATCWRVSEPLVPSADSVEIVVRAQDIVAQHKPPQTGPGTGTAADCEWKVGADAPVPVSLYFMFVDPASQANAGGYQWKTSFDLVAPDAPTELMAEVTGSSAKLTWTQSRSFDVAGYAVYGEAQSGNDCTRATLDEGKPAPSTPPLETVAGGSFVSQTISVESSPESLAVVAFDGVGNQSTQSNPACVATAAGVDPGSGDGGGCSASARSPATGAWLLGLLGSALAASAVRRRRR